MSYAVSGRERDVLLTTCILLSVLVVGCSGGKKKGGGGSAPQSAVDPGGSVSGGGGGGSATQVTVERISPITAKPGETLMVTGKDFSADMVVQGVFTLSDGSTKQSDLVPSLTSGGSTSATFTMPDGVGLGLRDLKFMQGVVEVGSFKLVADTADNSLPIIIDDQAQICSSKTYIDANGDQKTGTKNCSSPVACSADGAVGCVTTADFPAAAKADAASKILSGQSVAGVSGNVILPSAGDVRLGVSFGVSGASSGSLDPGAGVPDSCSSESQTNCVATTNFPAADRSRIVSNTAKILSGFSVVGVSGALSTCGDNDSNCFIPSYSVISQPLKAISYNSIDSTKMLDNLTISGVTGSIISRGSWNLTSAFPGAGYFSGTTNTPTPDTYTGTLFGTVGTVSLSPANCSANGQQSCVATGTYFAGTACTANGSGCYLPTYVPTTQPLMAINYDTINSNVGNIRSSTTLGGVTGTLADCTTNASTGCVTTPTYQSADLTNLSAGNIKSGVTIAGTAGQYPSSSFKLPGSSGTDLTAATFNAQIKSSATFQYFGPDGTRYIGTGDADIVDTNIKSGIDIFGTTGNVTAGGASPNAWDLRAGVTVGSVTGRLKVNCRNRVNSSIYNYDGAIGSIPQTGVTSGTAIDIWDTIDDYNNGGSGLPTNIVTAWGNNTDCGGVEAAAGDDNVWKDVTTTSAGAASTCAAAGSRCTMQDKITGLWWSKLQPTGQSWNAAWATCAGLTYNGQTGWRLPTQKELMEAHIHGIRSAARTNWLTDANMSAFFWSGSSVSNVTSNAWSVYLVHGLTTNNSKTTTTNQVVCVR